MTGRLWLIGVFFALAALPSCGQAPAPMPPDAHPSFEVATIKRSDADSQKQGVDSNGHSVVLLGETLKAMMMFAYQVHNDQIVGGPGWIATDKYDVEGIPNAAGDPDLSQIQEMVKKLLAERFGMTFHHEQRETAYYALIVAKSGAKLAKSPASGDRMPHQSMSRNSKQREAKFRNCQMSDFALNMQLVADRPVVDETGLKGRFDFSLRWQPDDAPAPEADTPPTLFTAIEEQLGIKLQPKKGPIEVIVIDTVARPSAN